MIKYLEGASNKVIVTLTERVTISNPFFLLILLSKATQEETSFWLTDTSAYPSRYNEFIMNDTLVVGDYLYNFYQKPNMDNTDLDDAVFLEDGKFKVYTIEAENKTYFD